MNNLFEQSKFIGRKIRLYTAKENHHQSTGVNDNPELWRKQEFIANILLNCEEQRYFAIDEAKLEAIHKEFIELRGIEVDLKALFSREWLRIVMGIVYMPATIIRSLYTLKKIGSLRSELLFLADLIKNKDGSLTRSDFEEQLKFHQQENLSKLDIAKAKESHLISFDEEKDIVKITNVSYYAPIIDNWDIFQFLEFLYDKENGDDNNLIMSKETIENIHTSHSALYKLTPSLKQMIDEGLAKEIATGYVISLFDSRYCSDEILDEAGAILWRNLESKHPHEKPRDRLKMWCRKMVITRGHSSDICEHLTIGEIDQFCRASIEIILQQPDLQISSTEYKKALLDFYRARDLTTLQWAERLKNIEFSKDVNDAFDLLKAISKMQRRTTDDFLYFHQSTREIISFLVRQIVKSHSCESHSLERFADLTKDIHNKPYLLWTLCFFIWEWRPELIPALMKNTALTSTLFAIVKKLNITTHIFDSPSEVKSKISIVLFDHVIDVLQLYPQLATEIQAKIIFDCLYETTRSVFQVKGQVLEQQREAQRDSIQVLDEIKQRLFNRPERFPTYGYHSQRTNKFYEGILQNLYLLVSKIIPENKYDNGTLDFQYDKISLLNFLHQLSSKIPDERKQYRLVSYDVADALLSCYTEAISAVSIASLDYQSFERYETTPTFLPATLSIKSVDWKSIFVLLDSENISRKFLYPERLNFNNTGDEYDSFNRFIISKLRTHLRVLLITYNQIKQDESILRQQGIQAGSLLYKIQNAILDISLPYSLYEPTKQRYDIFNAIDERPTFRGREDELIPLLGETSNNFQFQDRERLINSLIRTDSLTRTVKLIETMRGEQDQVLLINRLNSCDFAKELEGISSLNDFQYLLSELSSHVQFQQIAGQLFHYWEKKFATREDGILSNEIKVTTFRIRLLQAYQANDLKAILDVPEPNGDLYLQSTRIFPSTEKDFYKALYHLRNDNPKEAYAIYNDLMYRKDGDITAIALNRFASKIQWAEQEKDEIVKSRLFTEALDEWIAYQAQLSEKEVLEHISDNLLHNQLIAFDALKRYEEFDHTYGELRHIDRVRQGFFEIGVKNRVKRKLNNAALALIKDAMEFHKLKDGTVPQFVTDMNELIAKNQDPETLKELFSSVLTVQPEILVKLFPDSINGGKDVNSYILNNAVEIAADMLSKINSIAEIHFEDKYSDQMIFGLNSAMKFHHWTVSPARGGFSDSNLNNPGEIDFAVYGPRNQELAVFEALILYGENNTQVKKHSVKIFNYTPTKQGLFLLTYYRGSERNFTSTWDKYKNSITSIVEFPESYSFKEDSFTDLSSQYSNAAIRVGSTVHGENIILHHIFVNINYKV